MRPVRRRECAGHPVKGDGRADGRLEALGPPEPTRRAYWLVAPRPQWRQKKVRALIAFLTGQDDAA